jgi:hypothetical protein
MTALPARPVIEAELVRSGGDVSLYLVFDGKRIAKRGDPGTRYAKQWISIDPEFSVRDSRQSD